MISTDLLAKINCSFNKQDQRIILRSLLGNKLLSYALKEKEVYSFFFEDNPSLHKLMPANIGIFLIGPNKKLTFGDNSKQINTNLEEFSAEGSDRLQQMLGGNNFHPDLKDAFLISTSIYQGYLKQPTGTDFFELFKNHRILNDEIDLWGLIFACLVYFNNDLWNLIQKAMRMNPYPEFIKAIINCFYVNLMVDEKIEEVSIQLLNNQTIPVSTCYLEILRKQGLKQISQNLAQFILPAYQKEGNNIENLDPPIFLNDWRNTGKAIALIQNLALLNYFAGRLDETKKMFDKSKELMDYQQIAINLIESETSLNNDEKLNRIGDNHAKGTYESLDEKTSKEYIRADYLPVIPYKKINGLIEQGKYTEAEKIISVVKGSHVIDPNLYLLSAKLNIVRGGYEQAFNQVLVAETLDPTETTYKKFLAEVNYLLGHYQQAYETFSLLNPKGINLRDVENFCKYAISSGHAQEALSHAQNYLTENSGSDDLFLIAAEAAFSEKDFDKSISYLQKVIENKKDQPKAWLLIARINENKGEHKKSLEALLTGQKYSPESQSILFELAKIHANSGNQALFDEYISKIMAVPFESINLTLEICDLLVHLRKEDLVNQLLRKANEKWPQNLTLAKSLSGSYLNKGKFHLAVNKLEEAYEGSMIDCQGMKLYLLALFSSSEETFPIDAGLGDEQNQQKINNAISNLRNLSPNDPWLQLFTAVHLLLKKEYSHAYDLLSSFIAHSEDKSADILWRYQLTLGQVLMKIGKPEPAIVLFSDIADKKPTCFEVAKFLAGAFQACGLNEKAFEIIWNAFYQNPEKVKYIPWLSEFLFIIHKSDVVINEIRNNAEKGKKSSDELLLWIFLEQKNGNNSVVKKLLCEIQNNELTSSQSRLVFQLMMTTHDYPMAEKFLERIQEFDEEGQRKANLFKASLYYQQGKLTEAEQLLRTNIKSFSTAEIEQVFLMSVVLQMGEKEQLKELIDNNIFIEKYQDMNYFDQLAADIQDMSPVLPEEWKKTFSSHEDFLKLLLHAFIQIKKPEKGLEFLHQMLSLGKLSPALAEKAAEIAYGQLSDEETVQFTENGIAEVKKTKENEQLEVNLNCLAIELLLDQGDELRAASLLNKIIQGNEENPRVLALQARVMFREGDIENSNKIYHQVIEKTTRATTWLLESAIEFGDYESFVKLTCAISEENNITPRLVLLFLKEKAYLAKYSQISNELYSIKPSKVYIEMIEDLELKLTSHIAKMAEIFPRIAKWKEVNDALINMGKLQNPQIMNGEYLPYIAYLYKKDRNINELQILHDKWEDNPELNFLLALALAKSNPEQSRNLFSAAIARNPINPLYFAGLSFLERDCNNLQEFLTMIELALNLAPDELNWRRFAIEAAEVLADWGKVIFLGEPLLALDSPDESIAGKVIQGYIKKGNTLEAASLIKKMRMNPDESFELAMVLGKAALINKNYQEVINFSKKAQQLNPRSAAPLVLLSEMSMQLHQYEHALNLAIQATEKDFSEIEGHLAMANAINHSQGIGPAINYLESIVAKGIKSNLLLSKIAELIKSSQGAEKALIFLKANDNDLDESIFNQMANYEFELGNDVDAEKHAQQSLSIQTKQAAPYKLLAKIANKRGNLDQALKYISEVIDFKPADTETYILASDIYLQRREVAKAIEILNQGIKVAGANWMLYQKVGKIYYEIKDYKKAEEYFLLARQLNPKNQETKKQLDILSAMNVIHSYQGVRA